MKKSFILQESRGSIINDLDQAIEHGYKVELSYLNKPTGNLITRSVYLFSRGTTSKGKMCYRAFQYDPTRSSFEYSTKKNHGWRLFDIENIANYRVQKKKSKLWINGEIPNWLSSINTENDKMFTQTFKSMDIELFTDKHGRGNLSVKNRRTAIDKAKNTPEQPKKDEPTQLGLFDDPTLDSPKNSTIRKKRSYVRKPKQDNSAQSEIDFDQTDEPSEKPKILKKRDIQQPKTPGVDMDKEPEPTNNPDEETDDENAIENIDQIKESRIITKKDIL